MKWRGSILINKKNICQKGVVLLTRCKFLFKGLCNFECKFSRIKE